MYTFRSRDLNRHLSGESHIKQIFYKDVKDIINKMDEIIPKFKLEDNVKVFKGANKKYFENLKVGQEFKPKYFFSTSFDKSVAEKFIKNKRNVGNPLMIEIDVPKDTKSFYIGHDSGWSYYKELILDRNVKYKVLEFNDNKLKLEVMNDK